MADSQIFAVCSEEESYSPTLIPLWRELSRRKLSSLKSFPTAFFVHPSTAMALSISSLRGVMYSGLDAR